MRQRSLPPLIEFKNLRVERGSGPALCDLSLRIERGENVAIIGPNGSGKSTLIKTITREIYPQADVFRIFGEETWNIFDLKNQLGIVTPDLQKVFTRDITGSDVVLSGFFSAVELCWQDRVTSAMRKKVSQTLQFLDITHLKRRLMTELSTGEARRLLIGRALVHNPEALILDEPTTSLDIGAQKRFVGVLRKIASSGKNLVLVTHHLHDVIPEIKRVILLKKGKVFADGPKEKVLTEKKLRSLFGVPVTLEKRNGFTHQW
jgi:iron complex transport system ATP-binding protein